MRAVRPSYFATADEQLDQLLKEIRARRIERYAAMIAAGVPLFEPQPSPEPAADHPADAEADPPSQP
jgi:hypothetical protein